MSGAALFLPFSGADGPAPPALPVFGLLLSALALLVFGLLAPKLGRVSAFVNLAAALAGAGVLIFLEVSGTDSNPDIGFWLALIGYVIGLVGAIIDL
jgi:hypothetical protein